MCSKIIINKASRNNIWLPMLFEHTYPLSNLSAQFDMHISFLELTSINYESYDSKKRHEYMNSY